MQLSAGDNVAVGNMIPNAPLHYNLIGLNNSSTGASFTLFFFVDSTNRQSLSAIPIVSFWFRHALYNNDDIDGNENRIICIPNHPSQYEINIRDSSSDPTILAIINNSSTVPSATRHSQMLLHPMLLNTGFYHLPFHHPQRLPLLHLLNATRVPSVIVVHNSTGRIVTQYGWEAVEREYWGGLKQWADCNKKWIENQNLDAHEENNDDVRCLACRFESLVIKDWCMGRSGLPFHWHVLSWIL